MSTPYSPRTLALMRVRLYDARRVATLRAAALRREAVLDDGWDKSDALDHDAPDAGGIDVELQRIDAITRTLTITLSDIDHALVRLRAGSYGLCTQCCGPIGIARLRVIRKPACAYGV